MGRNSASARAPRGAGQKFPGERRAASAHRAGLGAPPPTGRRVSRGRARGACGGTRDADITCDVTYRVTPSGPRACNSWDWDLQRSPRRKRNCERKQRGRCQVLISQARSSSRRRALSQGPTGWSDATTVLQLVRAAIGPQDPSAKAKRECLSRTSCKLSRAFRVRAQHSGANTTTPGGVRAFLG